MNSIATTPLRETAKIGLAILEDITEQIPFTYQWSMDSKTT